MARKTTFSVLCGTVVALSVIAAGITNIALPLFAKDAATPSLTAHRSVQVHSRVTNDSAKINAGELLTLSISGLTLDQVQKSATTYYPRDGAMFLPATTWKNELVVFFMAKNPGRYMIGIYSPGKDSVVKTETEITVGDVPPGPNPPPPDPGPTPTVQKVWLVIVENSLTRTSSITSLESAVQEYANAFQDGRYKRLDRSQTDQSGAKPKGFERFIDSWNKGGDNRPVLSIVGEDGKTLETHAISDSDTVESIITLVKKYGG
jgi:hypothetical protein